MNESVKYFLPSLIRGVYRFDERLSRIKSDEDARNFLETKLRFIPERYTDIVRNVVNIEEVNFSDTIENKLLSFKSPLFNTQNKQRYQQYFSSYDYFSNQEEPNGDAPNYLEAEFVRSVLAPILSTDGLLKFLPQTSIESYLADFTLEGSKKYIFEVDGFGKFETRDSLDKFLKRQNILVKNGWTVLRYSYTDIKENTERTRKQIHNILKSDDQICPFLLKHNPHHDQSSNFGLFGSIQRRNEKHSECDILDLVNDFYLAQDFCITQLILKPYGEDAPIFIEDCLTYPFPLVALALSDLFFLLNDLQRLFGVSFELPAVSLVYKHFDHQFNSFLHPLVKVHAQNEGSVDTIRVTPEMLLTFSPPLSAPQPDETAFNYVSDLVVERIKEYLTYIVKSIFRYTEGTKAYQDKVLQHIFNKKDILGIYPTGCGKSFCFWLPALLKPGLSIVICPLRSLMRDQRLTLENYGIVSVDFINSDVTKEERLRIVNDAKLGKLKLLYIAPERMRIKDFVEELKSIQNFVKINYLIIDESHCISEWGHDFRPSYLNIPYFYNELKQHNKDVQLIALTATAGEMVRKDIVNLLNLKDKPLTEPDLDRTHFSLQIETVDGYEQKVDKFAEVLTESIPKSLSHSLSATPEQSTIHKVITSRNRNDEKAIGIIYVVYADPHGRHSTLDGLAHYLYETKKIIEPDSLIKQKRKRRNKLAAQNIYSLDDYDTGKVRAFSSKPPTLCPICYTYDYVTRQTIDDESDFEFDENIQTPETQTGRKVCRNCGHEFDADKAKSPPKYAAITQKNQNDFKRGDLDILVATKGFGMGIDKSSVRFVLHTTPPSSIESWYQEIGRAGRDEERAHCVAIADVPNEACLKELSRLGRKEPRCNWRTGCPHGKNGLCDYGKQHMFIKRSYTGVVSDVISAIRTLDKLITSFLQGSSGTVWFPTNHTYLKYHELSLFRLKLLGIVEDFSVTYGGLTVFFDVTLKTDKSQDGRLTIWTDAEAIKNHLRIYLEKNKLLPNEIIGPIDNRIKECKQKWDTDVQKRLDKKNLSQYQKYPGFYHGIIDYLLVLLDHTYENIVWMRYDMLYNLYVRVILPRDHCRRKPVIDHLAGGGTYEEDYKCGLCDNCVTNLHFTLDSRRPPKESKKTEELEAQLESAYESRVFDLDQLVRLKDAFRDYPSRIYNRSRATLEGSPRNLVALYFTREFSPEKEREANTVRLLETANRSLDMATVSKLYDSSSSDYKPKLLFILNDEFGQFNNEEGRVWLYSKTKEEISKTENVSLLIMQETLYLFLLCKEMETQPDKFIKSKQEIEEVYYGRNN